MIDNPVTFFKNELSGGKKLCLLPIARINAEAPVCLAEDLVFYPKNSINPDMLGVIWEPEREWENFRSNNHAFHPSLAQAEGDEQHRMKSVATGISARDFFSEGLLAFPSTMDWDNFLSPDSHEHHLSFIFNAAAKVEKLLNMIRFDYCRIDLSETIPGKAGLTQDMRFSSALFYTPIDHESYIIAGDAVRHAFLPGLGLQVDDCVVRSFPDGEVHNIANHALHMHTDALEAKNDTAKFINLLNLLDYLEEPSDLLPKATAKDRIARHTAKNKQEYEEIVEDFELLTSKKDELGGDIGLHHNIIHSGARIEELLPDQTVRRRTLMRMNRYACIVIENLLRMSDKKWTDVEDFRKEKGVELGLE